MKNRLFDVFMPILPKNDLSHWVGRAVHRPLPGMVGRKSVEWFAKFYNIDLSEAEHSLSHYNTIGELFTRRLKPGARPIGDGFVVHPADAVISQAGTIDQLQMIQAKGKTYTVPELLRSGHFAADFEGGTYFTYYLCPTDYHRVHSPLDGEILWSCHVPGELWPVNEWSVNRITNLFSTNERIVTILESEKGKAALVMVAATNVGNMTLSYDESIHSKYRRAGRQVRERSYNPRIPIRKGDEIGIFHMGSTVIMLYEKGLVPEDLIEGLRNKKSRVGESLETPKAL